MWRMMALALAGVVLAAACGGSAGSKPTPTSSGEPTRALAVTATAGPPAEATTLPPASAAPSAAACSPARPHPAGSSNNSISSGGAQRSYLLEVPSSYTGSEALPLVFNFHGFGSNDVQQAAYSGFPAKGGAEGFFVVTPQGSGQRPYWNSLGLNALPDDVGFTRDLLDRLESELCIDAHRLYATGISNGAAMSIWLACSLSDRIVAVAGVSGVFYPQRCDATRAVPVLAFHGTADPIVPYNGGPINAGISQILHVSAPPIEDAVREWAQHDSCDLTPASEQVSQHVRLIVYSGCQEGASVELYSIDGGGHTWPGGAVDAPSALLGPTTHEISATDLIWAFFAAHALP